MEYKKYINKKLSEFTKKNKKSSQNLHSGSNKSNYKTKTSPAHYKKLNKNTRQKNNELLKRRISPYLKNVKFKGSSNKSKNKSYNNPNKKPKYKCNINIINANNHSRSSSNNSKSSFNVLKKNKKNKNLGIVTLKNFIFSKK